MVGHKPFSVMHTSASGKRVRLAGEHLPACRRPVSLSSTLDFLLSPSEGERASDSRSSGNAEGTRHSPVPWPPPLREGRMELQGRGISKHDMDFIVEHLSQVPRPASASESSRHDRSAATEENVVFSLHLSDNDLQPAATAVLARELRFNTWLKALDLSSNSIGDQGASALSAVLIANTTLEALDIASNGISQRGIDCLMAGMCHNLVLKSFELSFNGFGDAACQSIGKALQVNASFQYLGLGFNGITCAGAQVLSRGLHNSRSLQRLELSYNALGDVGAAAIAEALKNTPHLQTLGLVNNAITDDGAVALAEGLAGNQSLQVLGLSSNNIGDVGATAMAAALRRNDTLIGLYLEENDITEAGSCELKLAQETTRSCKLMAADLQLTVMSGLHRRLGADCPLFALDPFILREILGMCDVRRPRDVLYFPKIIDIALTNFEV